MWQIHHANSSDDQEGLTPKVIEPEDRRQSKGDLEDASHTGGQQLNSDGGETESLEDLRRVVQDGVDMGVVHVKDVILGSTYQ